MIIKEFSFSVVSNEFISQDIRFLVLENNNQIDFLAGQYFTFKLADKVNRSYSIASQPHIDKLEFLIGINPNGVGSNLINQLQVGDNITAIGPLGFFTIEKHCPEIKDSDSFIFIATGTGIAPIRSIVKDLLINKKVKNYIHLFFGLRFDNQAYFFDEFNKLASMFSNFKFYPVISRPSLDWTGYTGYCQDIIVKTDLDKNSNIFVCGSNKNVDSIINFLIDNNFKKEKIFFEKFG